MSSRYALQYQIGIIGIFLTFALAAKCGFCRKKATLAMPVKTVSIALAAMFLIGNVMTTTEEFRFGKYRKEHNRDEVKQILLNFENESDNTLEDALEYHKPGCRSALTICLLYTSDAADEEDSVDLDRHHNKKKKKKRTN